MTLASAWNDASGRAHIQKGFAFDARSDALFALGWPHVRLLDDEPMDSLVAMEAARRQLLNYDPTPRITWNRRLANAMVRALCFPAFVDLLPNEKVLRAEVEESLWNPRPVTREEVAAGIALRMRTGPLGLSDRTIETWVLLAEALVGTSVVAHAIVDTLENLDRDTLAGQWALPPLITFQLGYLLLRLSAKEGDPLRARLQALLKSSGVDFARARTAADAGTSHLRSLWLVTGGAEAAKRGTDKNLGWCTHVQDDATFVRMRVATDRLGHRPDGRLVFLGGTAVLPYYAKRWRAFGSGEQRWVFEQIADIQSEHTARIALEMSGEPALRADAEGWFRMHHRFGRAYLKGHVDGRSAWMDRAREVLAVT